MEKLMNTLRDKLNKMLNSNKYTYNEILSVSQQLDELIVYYYKFQKKYKS